VADFGHAMSPWHQHQPKVWQISSRAKTKTKAVCSQNTKHGTAEPFHLFHMGPMSDITVL
jgi:hypothetical protein